MITSGDRLLWRAGLRFQRKHPWQLFLNVAAIALGVAVVLAVDLSRSSALRAFDISNDKVFGRTTHSIIGISSAFAEELYRDLRVDLGQRSSAPVVAGRGALGEDRVSVSILGIDPIADTVVRGFSPGLAGDWPVERFMTGYGAIVSRDLLASAQDSVIDVVLRGTVFELQVLTTSAELPSRTVVVDVSTAQEMLGLVGKLSRIDLRLDDDKAAELVPTLKAWLPIGVELVPSARRSESIRRLTRAFEINLVALGMLSLLVGMFLIYNTVTFLVLLRREQFGALRALGVTPAEVRRAVMVEVLVLAIAGAALGLVLGVALASALLGLVSQTINDLYFATAVNTLGISPGLFIKAVAMGVAVSLLAGWLPAREAGNASPRRSLQRQQVESDVARWAKAGLFLALLFAGASAVVLLWPTGGLIAGFGGLFLLIAAAVCVAPWCLRQVLIMIRGRSTATSSLGLSSRLALGTLSRTGVAAAALMVAVATTLGIGLMINSFRDSVDDWLGRLLQADVYISASDSGTRLDQQFVSRVEAMAGVRDVTTVHSVWTRYEEESVGLVAYELNAEGFDGFEWLDGAPNWDAFSSGEIAIVTEPFSRRFGVSSGESISLGTPMGPQQLTVGGVYRDYGAQQGVVAVSRTWFARWFEDEIVSGVGVYLAEGAAPETFIQALEAELGGDELLDVAANKTIRELAMEVFDRTFLVTQVLRAVTGLVAFAGVLGALMAVMIERRKEFATLRALGYTQSQVRRSMLMQSGLVGGVAGFLALPLGVMVALALIYAVNVRAFGWSMALQVDSLSLVVAFAIAIIAALLAAIVPAGRIASSPLSSALRSQ